MGAPTGVESRESLPLIVANLLAWYKAECEALHDALEALYEAEGHRTLPPCSFSGCDCGAVQRRAEARAQAAKALRRAPAPEARRGP